jgi:diguanylate cyclase (GGDEF)-like protein
MIEDPSRARAGPPLSRLSPVSRRVAYPILGAVLAAGAPLGLALLRAGALGEFGVAALARAVNEDRITFLYVTVSTSVVFAVFGHLLGWHADRLVHLSRTDPLTGLGNQRAFEERLMEEVARAKRYPAPLSLLIADVDGLKAINDRGGHHAGNVALCAVADALVQGARQTDQAARIGGDEFALIAPNTVALEAVALGERIRSLLAEGNSGVTISIGVAMLDPEHPDPAQLLETGDAALYVAKRRGRNQVALGGSPA